MSMQIYQHDAVYNSPTPCTGPLPHAAAGEPHSLCDGVRPVTVRSALQLQTALVLTHHNTVILEQSLTTTSHKAPSEYTTAKNSKKTDTLKYISSEVILSLAQTQSSSHTRDGLLES